MNATAASLARASGACPSEAESPLLDALEGGAGSAQERSWYLTLLCLEDLWASAIGAKEPDPNDTLIRVRPLLEGIARQIEIVAPRLPLDDLQRAVGFLVPPLRAILARPNTCLARTHQQVPWARLDELDARSLAWMSRLPGRTMLEKSSTTARALGVVRVQSLEVTENRVLARLIRELRPWVDRRRRIAEGVGENAVDPRYQDLLALHHWIEHEWPASAVSTVRPAVRPGPNNALLGSGHYGRVWRAWRWLGRRQDRFAALWRGGAPMIQRALGCLLAARLGRRPEAFVIDDVGAVRLDGTEPLLGLVGSPSLDVLLAGASPRAVSIQAPDGVQPLRIVILDAATGVECSSFEVEVGFDGENLEPGRGCPVRLSWIDVGRELLGEVRGWFDPPGVDALLDAVVAALDAGVSSAPRLLVAGARGDDRLPVDLRHVSADLSAATPIVVADASVSAHRPVCAAIDVHVDTEHVQRVVGDDALAFRCDRAVRSSFFLAESWSAVAAGEAAVGDLASALHELLPAAVHPDCELCVPVPDGLGEPGEALLREALPGQVRRTWLIPRAVSAVMALRAEAPDVIAVGESVLVLDCGPLGFEARLLTLRRDATAIGADPCLWVCPLPWAERPEAAAGASRGFWQTVARFALGPDVAQEYVDRAVSSGLVTRVATDPDARSGALVIGPRGQIGPLVTVSQEMLDTAATELATHLRAWLATLAAAVLAEVRDHRGPGHMHVLLVGEPLVVPAVALAARGACTAVLPDAVVRVASSATTLARGGLAFLERKAAGEPTFELALPDLYLTVDKAGVATSVPIFQKQCVRPGAVITVPPLPFELKAGADKIELPLQRDRDGRRPLAHRAVLQGEGLPLRASLRVDLLVSYRYAEDGFRIRVQPRHLDGTTAAFEGRELRWLRASNQAEARSLRNEPPQVPAPRSFVLDDADRAAMNAAELWARLDLLLSVQATPPTKRAAGRTQSELDREIRAAIRELNEVGKDVGKAFSLGAVSDLPPALKTAISARWVGPLCFLVESQPRPYDKATPRWAAKAGDLRNVLPHLVEAAARALTRLGRNAPPDVPQGLLRELKAGVTDRRRDECVRGLGRALLALSPPAQSEGIRLLVEIVCAPSRASDEAPWWALATLFWGDPRLVARLALDDVERLLVRVDALLAATLPPQVALFDEVTIVLMALLLRRGQADAGPVDAGDPRLKRLADRIEDLERPLVAAGSRREPRLKLASPTQGRTDVSAFVDSLAAALRGERVALIRMLED